VAAVDGPACLVLGDADELRRATIRCRLRRGANCTTRYGTTSSYGDRISTLTLGRTEAVLLSNYEALAMYLVGPTLLMWESQELQSSERDLSRKVRPHEHRYDLPHLVV